MASGRPSRVAFLHHAQRIREPAEVAQDAIRGGYRRYGDRRAHPDGDKRGRSRHGASASRDRPGTARGGPSRRARGHDVLPGEYLARHPDRHRDVAPVARAREIAPPDERRGDAQRPEGSPMTEEEDRMEYAEQNSMLRRKFDSILTEPIP